MLLRHLQTFILRADERAGPGLPGFVRRELYRYLDCGILASGFARVHCASCGRDELVIAHARPALSEHSRRSSN